jgi:uncharacterized membrane protein
METSDLWNRWKEHIPLLIGAGTTLFIAVRLLSVAGFDLETAYGILQEGGTAAIVIGAIIPLIGGIAVMVCSLSAASFFLFDKAAERNYWAALGILAGIVSAFIAPLINILVISPVVVLICFLPLMARRRRKAVEKVAASGDEDQIEQLKTKLDRQIASGERFVKIGSYAQLAGMAVVIALAAINTDPWLPAMRLTVNDSQSFTAYILSSGSEMGILLNSSRKVEYISSRDVAQEVLCSTDNDALRVIQTVR